MVRRKRPPITPDPFLEALSKQAARRAGIKREKRDRASAFADAQRLQTLNDKEQRFAEILSHRGIRCPDEARQLIRSCVAGKISLTNFGRRLEQKFPDIYRAVFKFGP